MKLKNVLIVLAMIIAFLLIQNTEIFAKTVIVDTDTLRIRKEASTDSTTLELLNLGEKLEYIEESGDWYKVKVRGITGYVHKDYVKLEQDEENIEETNTETNTQVNESETNEEVNQNETVTEPENNNQENEVITNTEETPAETKEMKVSKDSKIYILPLINANTIQDIVKDSNVTIISKTNGWAYVETDEVMGWIRQDLLIDSTVVSDDNDVENPQGDEPQEDEKQDEQEPETMDKEITSKIMYVNSNSVYVRKGPGTDYEVVDSLILNNSVKVTAENGEWYKVEVDGKTGYIAKWLLSNEQTNTTSRGDNSRAEVETTDTVKNTTENTTIQNLSKGEQIVEFAKKYLGCKYVYGASGPNTFDCSGFTMYVLKNFGVTLSHSARAQSKVGTYVAKENLQPGDLVFFTDYETGVGIGHCGIYVGDGNFIHASSGTGYCVKISTLTSGSYLNRYETARRLI